MLTAAGDRRSNLIAKFDGLDNDCERAAWLWTTDPDLFHQAEQTKFANDHREGRSWSGYLGPQGVEPDISGATAEQFKSGIAEIFDKRIGVRGQVLIETFRRSAAAGLPISRELFQVTIYAEDLPKSNLTIDRGQIDRVTMRPALEAIVTYLGDNGEIEVIAKGGRSVRDSLASCFVETILDGNEGLESIQLRRVDLSVLNRPFEMPIDPMDGIASARLSKLRLRNLGSRGLRFEIAAPNAVDRSPHQVRHELFGTPQLDQTSWVPDGARITFELHPRNGNARKRLLHVDLYEPNRCSLKEKTEAERLIGEKYVRKLGLVSDVAS